MTQDQEKICSITQETVNETFESMIFMPVISLPKDMPKPTIEGNHFAKLEFLAPMKGIMYLAVPPNLATEITKNLYGWMDESEMTDEVIQDAMAELVNTVAGQFLSKFLPEDQTFEIGLPTTGETVFNPSKKAVVCYFLTEQDGFTIALEGDFF